MKTRIVVMPCMFAWVPVSGGVTVPPALLPLADEVMR